MMPLREIFSSLCSSENEEDKVLLLHDDADFDSDFDGDIHSEKDESIVVDDDVKSNGISSLSAFWNVCNSIQGVAILAMPYAIKGGGWWSVLAMALVAVVSNYTGQILINCHYEEILDDESQSIKLVRARQSYADIGASIWPTYGRNFVLFIQVLELLFMATLYPIVGTSVMKTLLPQAPLSSAMWIALFGVIVTPNAFLRRLHHISIISTVTVISAAFIFGAVCLYCFTQSKQWSVSHMNDIVLEEYVAAIGVIVASYSSQMYLAVIEADMKKPQHFGRVMNYGYTAMTIFKIGIGVMGYITFGSDTKQVVTLNLPDGMLLNSINGVVMLMSLTSYTLPMFTAFEIIERDMPWLISSQAEPKIVVEEPNQGRRLSMRRCSKPTNFSCQVSLKEFVLRTTIRLSLIVVTLLMAASVPHFCLVLAFIGSFTGATLELLLPIIFYTILRGAELKKWILTLNISLLIGSIFFMAVGVYYSASSMIIAFQNHTKEVWTVD